MSDHRYAIEWTSAASRQVRKAPKPVQQQILALVELLSSNPRPAKAVKLTDAKSFWRVRAGDYRVVYQIEDGALRILVVKTSHRRDVYHRL